MSRIVDVEPLDCLAWKDGEHGTTFDDGVLWVLEKIGELPSVQSEIIRCKDCKHRPITTRADEGIDWGSSLVFPDECCPYCCEDGYYSLYPDDDFYCGKAERRTDEWPDKQTGGD